MADLSTDRIQCRWDLRDGPEIHCNQLKIVVDEVRVDGTHACQMGLRQSARLALLQASLTGPRPGSYQVSPQAWGLSGESAGMQDR